MPDGDKVRELFSQFVQARQSGQDRDDAWHCIEATVSTLPSQDRELLLAGLRHWETSDGQAIKTSSDPNRTQSKPPAQLAEKRNVIRRIVPAPATIPIPALPPEPATAAQPDRLECPACHKPNSLAALHCYSCGAILKSPAALNNATRPLAANSMDNAFFGENWVLYLKVQATGETVRVQPRLAEVILGRKSPDSAMVPDVDLCAYGAGDKGVSRLHASVRRQDQTLVLSDLGSINHTFINGQRVHPHEVRVLHDGDELRLGSLVLYAYFRET